MKKIINVLSFLLIFSNSYSNNSDSLLSQKSTDIKDTTEECTVVTVSKVTYNEVNLFGLSDSSVNILKENLSREIFIKDIRSIKFKGAGIWKSAAYGAGIGFAIGFLAGAFLIDSTDTGNESISKIGEAFLAGFGLAIIGSVVGGVLGAVVPKDQIYNFRKSNFEANRMTLKYIFKKYSNR